MRIQIEPIPAWRWERHQPKSSPFSANYTDTLALLDRELRMLLARGTVALQLVCQEGDIRRDGLLRAGAKLAYDGVAISFESKFGALTYPCDTYRGWQSNLRAIALSLEALRAADRHGVARRGEQYAGWRAIEGAAERPMTSEDALIVIAHLSAEKPGHFDVTRDLQRYREHPSEIRRDYRQAARLHHPDTGGSPTAWARLDKAWRVLQESGAAS